MKKDRKRKTRKYKSKNKKIKNKDDYKLHHKREKVKKRKMEQEEQITTLKLFQLPPVNTTLKQVSQKGDEEERKWKIKKRESKLFMFPGSEIHFLLE